MFPIRDTIATRRFPIVNCILIALNILAFLFQISLDEQSLNVLIQTFGIVPELYTDPLLRAQYGGNFLFYIPFFSNMFLHGGWLHLIGNIWTLYIFGDNVEDRMGKFKYLAFYLLCGVLASATHILFNWDSPIPAIGASGAISGVMGAYMFLFSSSRILMLIPIFYIPFFFRIPAYVYLGYWFLIQFFSGAGEIISSEVSGGVAFWAHIGGFVAGVIIYRFFTDRNYTPPETFQSHKRDPIYIYQRGT
ncbi:MAG: rhomboid family intramembrane serine protease [Bacteroidetes bacterium]|nr:rhomboid family intramembrane serine protease [Bacteroidota bacterium]MCB0841877.1 rhomboid family intramembrane serine protease [Bacteroidota bacterium]